jgi:hypothetical protein
MQIVIEDCRASINAPYRSGPSKTWIKGQKSEGSGGHAWL